MISELKGHTDTIYALKFSRDGEVLASGMFSLTHVAVRGHRVYVIIGN